MAGWKNYCHSQLLTVEVYHILGMKRTEENRRY